MLLGDDVQDGLAVPTHRTPRTDGTAVGGSGSSIQAAGGLRAHARCEGGGGG